MVETNRTAPVLKRPDINAIEADLAFFSARIALSHRGFNTLYQQAQRKTYETLIEVLSLTLRTLKQRHST